MYDTVISTFQLIIVSHILNVMEVRVMNTVALSRKWIFEQIYYFVTLYVFSRTSFGVKKRFIILNNSQADL